MKKILLTLLSLTGFLFNISASAQGLASLEKAPEYNTGVLPNGIEYYIVTNRTSTEKADFAVIQQGQPDRFLARRVLSYARHFGNRHPYDFLAENGIGYDKNGYISYREDGILFDFKNAPVKQQSVCDSLILLMFDIAATYQGPQALIISGDVDAPVIAEKVRLLSMVLSNRDKANKSDNYTWTPQENSTYYYTSRQAENLAALRISYGSARVPRDRMNTLQPSVVKMYSSWFGTILARRIRDDFYKHGIPVGDLFYRYYDSSMGKGDEQYTMTLITSPEYYEQAVCHTAEILADLDNRGVTVKELQDAKDKLVATAIKEGDNTAKSNESYVRRCTAAFMYGAHLASDGTINNFFSRSAISNEKEVELFNNFIFAVIDPKQNLTIGFDEQTSRSTDLAKLFGNEWAKSAADSSCTFAVVEDSLKLYEPKEKTRIRTESKEPISGGSLWTFTNGTRVIYKKTSVKGMFTYALMMRGGYTDVKDMKPGENAFVSDMLGLSRIGGIPGIHFEDALANNGITMETDVNLSDMRIQGTAPSERLEVLLKSLLTIAYDREPDEEAFKYYKSYIGMKTELDRRTESGLNNMLDSLLAPAYRYPVAKNANALQDDLPERAEAFFQQQFSKCADGVLVLIGDLDEDSLKKQLCNYMGDFRTSKKLAVRPKVSREATVGTTTYTIESRNCPAGLGDECVNLAFNAPIVFNMTNYMAMRISLLALRDELAKSLCNQGAAASISGEFELFPEERVSMHINCTACPESGLPEGIENKGTLHILHSVRAGIDKLATSGVSEAELNHYKNSVISSYGAKMNTDSGIVEAILVRYSEGRDIRSNYKESINALKPENIAQVMKTLKSGGQIELVLL